MYHDMTCALPASAGTMAPAALSEPRTVPRSTASSRFPRPEYPRVRDGDGTRHARADRAETIADPILRSIFLCG